VGFQKAEKRKAWLKLGFAGPSGAGKTYSALAVASGMGKRIAVIDTENGSASLYADRFEFDVLEIDSPFTVEKYVEAIKQALSAKYEVLIIDSVSHAWAGEGGLLDQKETLDARGGKGEKNKFANWRGITKQHEHFKAWLLKADIHLIVTLRAKQDYVLGEGNTPQRVGLAPIQREGFEYELGTLFELALDHTARATKDRTSLFDKRMPFVPGPEHGKELMAWLQSGKGDLVQRGPEKAGGSSSSASPDPLAQLKQDMFATGSQLGYSSGDIADMAKQLFPGVKGWGDLTAHQIDALVLSMKNHPKAHAAPPAAEALH
jgi:hypothetical protein